jgi:uncharacterized protein with von Willebrand factor type A (vWA) domain
MSRDFFNIFEEHDDKELSKNSILHDNWDAVDYRSILNEMRELDRAEDRLTSAVSTGSPFMADTYFSLVKAGVKLEDPNQMRPSYAINRAVAGEMTDMKEHEELRLYSVGDPIAAGISCVNMEPTIEEIFDRLNEEQKLAEEIEQQLQELAGMGGEAADLEDAINAALAEGDEQAAQDFQEQKSLIEAQMEMLKQQMQENIDKLDQSLQSKKSQLKADLRAMLQAANDDAENQDSLMNSWGLDPGSLQKMPAEERIELANRLNNDRFKRIAQKVGQIVRLAMSEQARKTNFNREEAFDIEMGNDLSRVLPSEFIYLDDEDLELLFYKKFIEHDLLQVRLRGNEKVSKGAIILCEDGSASMAGEREIWAKAVALAFIRVAREQIRAFYGIHFGGTGMVKEFDFRDIKNIRTENVIEYAECFFNGGTDFMTPLTRALGILQAQHEADGAVNGDIVFVTDGECGVSAEWLEEFQKEKERLGFRVWGVSILGSPTSEPLNTICDGRVYTIKDLTNATEMREVFREI